MLLICTSTARAQAPGGDLRIYGYFQTTASGLDTDIFDTSVNRTIPEQRVSFALQQFNLLVGKDLTNDFTAFLNLEFTNNFSTRDGWGSLKVEEAWVRYQRNRAFNLKVGIQIPIFNNLNEIKNRTPLLPNIMRPSVYEASFSDVLPIDAFVPQQAFVQAYGSFPLRDVTFDYSVHLGNQDAFITNTPRFTAVPGTDTTTAVLVGGRIGLRHRGAKLGISATMDDDNLDFLQLGAVPRIRFGVDASFRYRSLFVESEYITLSYDPTAQQQGQLDLIALFQPGVIGNSLDKRFYYILGGYNITDRLFVYAYTDYLEDQVIDLIQGGFRANSLGGGYRFADSVVGKVQFIRAKTIQEGIFEGNLLFASLSVLF